MIKSVPLSFVRFEHPVPNDYSLDRPLVLPAFGGHDIAFQFLVAHDQLYTDPLILAIGNKNGDFINLPGITCTPIKYRYSLANFFAGGAKELVRIQFGATSISYAVSSITAEQLSYILLNDWGVEVIDQYFLLDTPEVVSINVNDTVTGDPVFTDPLPVYWHAGYVVYQQVTTLPDCFTYRIQKTDGSLQGYTNQFMKVAEAPYSSLVDYRCNEEAMGFYYPAGIKNRLRLPFYLFKPQYPSQVNVLKMGNGRNKVLSGVLEKEYEIETEQMPEIFHEAFAAMLQHDTLTISNTNIRETSLEVVESGPYNPNWETDDTAYSKGKGKVKVANYPYSNTNCK